MHTFYEFFAGGGMARAGLGPAWNCLFANDLDRKKAAAYVANWGDRNLSVGDIAQLKTSTLPGSADLAWASFPCQDLSLAGAGAGLAGVRSGTFWPFWKLMDGLVREKRAPRVIVLENVCGAITSHGGKDFAAIGKMLAATGYKFGAVVIDAVDFVPQSRPRLFIIGTLSCAVPSHIVSEGPIASIHPAALIAAHNKLNALAMQRWVWWKLPAAAKSNATLSEVIEDEPTGVEWHTRAQTSALLAMMSRLNRKKVDEAKKSGGRVIGGVYKRTRPDEKGRKVQRAEVRFDEIAGCLRTPAGGSSRQSILVVEGSRVRSRLLSPRETARLMGLPEHYKLPSNYNEAYHLAGDGVVVPVVRFLAEHILEPLIVSAGRKKHKKAA
jgi:DNA (cytosine-5)-methyltransferase 1